MEVEEAEAVTIERDGTTHHFCSEGCRDRFLEARPREEDGSSYERIIIAAGEGAKAALAAKQYILDSRKGKAK
jgi:thioredoxin reductase